MFNIFPLWWLDRRQSCNLAPAYLFVLRHTNSQFPRIFYTSLLLFCPLVVMYDTWFETHVALLQLTGFSKLQDTKSFLFTWKNAMFAHHCLLAEKRVTTPSHLSRKNVYISSIRWHAFISYMWVCYCTAKPLNPGWTYETRCRCTLYIYSIVQSMLKNTLTPLMMASD
jgi:hypothetical protein